MVFSSAIFLLLFLPIVYIGNLLINKEFSNVFLLFASLFFYSWGEPFFILIMLTSILINWCIGCFLYKLHGIPKKIVFFLGIVCNLGILGYYKYAEFFAQSLNWIFRKETIPVIEIALPIGISFFTFQALSYIIDVYRGDTDPSLNPINVALYISFFPQLIAGPIVKYRDINKQIESRTISWIDTADGFKRFIYGLGKKVLISNVLGQCADTIYSYDIASVDCKTAWIGAIAYTFQIYYDFSGYSDMAIGLGKMFGFNIPENFNYPYLSHSISEFWRRWHISLGAWFREYVYIPLGGNKKGTFRTYINLIIVFLLTGLWHGADISFIIWGLFHGSFCIIERIGLNKLLNKSRIISSIYMLFIVNIGWVFFRSSNTISGLRYISRMLLPWRHTDISIASWNYMDNKTILTFILAICGSGILRIILPSRIKNTWSNSIPEAIYCVCLLILCLASIAGDTYNPFIYFQF